MIRIVVRPAIKVNGRYALFFSCNYRPYIINRLSKFGDRFFHKNTKEWEFSTKYYKELCQVLSDIDTITLDKSYYENIKKRRNINLVPAINVDNFKFKTVPYKHQKECFTYGLTRKNWLLADEQGLGKSKEVIDIAVAKKQNFNYKHCLIICCINGLKWNWKDEITIHSDETGYILGQRTGKRSKKITVKSNKEKLEDIKNIQNIKDYFIITNIETLRNNEIAKELSELCYNNVINMIAIDEVHKCNNPDSSQTQGLMLLHSECKIGMTGTPIMNNPLDAYVVLRWLGYEKNNYFMFRSLFCDFGSYNQIIRYKNLDVLRNQLSKIMLRRLKKDVLDLPDKIHINEYVDLSKTQQMMYNETERRLKSEKDNITSLAAFTRLRQITGYSGILDNKTNESSKFDRMRQIVEESVANGKKVIIFSVWTKIIEPAFQLLSEYNPAVITGKLNDKQQNEQKNKFQNDPDCKVILGTVAAMGTGFTLTSGTVVIFIDEPWTDGAKTQAIDRAHRIGTKDDILIYTIMVKNSIDERVHRIVTDKGVMADMLVDGTVRSQKEIINYLLFGYNQNKY